MEICALHKICGTDLVPQTLREESEEHEPSEHGPNGSGACLEKVPVQEAQRACAGPGDLAVWPAEERDHSPGLG